MPFVLIGQTTSDYWLALCCCEHIFLEDIDALWSGPFSLPQFRGMEITAHTPNSRLNLWSFQERGGEFCGENGADSISMVQT